MNNAKNQSWADANGFTHHTRRYFADAMGEDATVLKKTQTLKMRHITDKIFRVF